MQLAYRMTLHVYAVLRRHMKPELKASRMMESYAQRLLRTNRIG